MTLRSSLIAVLIALVGGVVSAQDWGQWRGPSRDGFVPASVAPKSWPAAVKQSWRIDIGEGYSSPVVSAGRVFAHSRRDPEEIVTAVDLATGKRVWQQTYSAAFQKNQYAVQMAKGPNSTPLVAGNRLYTLGVTGVLSAWNVADGALLWRKDYSPSVDTSKLFCGAAMSPLIEGGSLIVQVGSDIHGGRVLALDPATGAERWTWTGLGPGYASPVTITVGGVRQIATMTQGSIVGINAKTGSSLWSIPFPDDFNENIVTPIWTGSHVIVSGTRQGTQAYALTQTAGKWHAAQAWKNADVTMYMSTPVFADGVIYGISNKRRGHLVALDATTGQVKWATQGRDGSHASILLTPAHVLFLTNGADLIVAKRGTAEFAEERRYHVADSETWAMPVLLSDGMVLRDATGLLRLVWSS